MPLELARSQTMALVATAAMRPRRTRAAARKGPGAERVMVFTERPGSNSKSIQVTYPSSPIPAISSRRFPVANQLNGENPSDEESAQPGMEHAKNCVESSDTN